jgi:hypothetical protein
MATLRRPGVKGVLIMIDITAREAAHEDHATAGIQKPEKGSGAR